MARMLLLVVAVIGLSVAYRHLSRPYEGAPLPGDAVAAPARNSAVTVYGRDRCGLTQRMLRELQAAGVPHQYRIIDEPAIADQVHGRMRAQGLSTASYMLPVVDVGGTLYVGQRSEAIVSVWRGLRR